MTRRLLLAPLVVAPVAAVSAALWCSGLAWAVGVQVAAYCKRRTPGEGYEMDVAS